MNGNTPTSKYGGVAQLGEHLLCKQGVIGSNPFISTSPADGNGLKLSRKHKRARGKPPLKPRNGLIAQPVRAHA